MELALVDLAVNHRRVKLNQSLSDRLVNPRCSILQSIPLGISKPYWRLAKREPRHICSNPSCLASFRSLGFHIALRRQDSSTYQIREPPNKGVPIVRGPEVCLGVRFTWFNNSTFAEQNSAWALETVEFPDIRFTAWRNRKTPLRLVKWEWRAITIKQKRCLPLW